MAEYSDPYEAWKQAGRPGGTFRPAQGAPPPGTLPQYQPGAAPQATPMAYTGTPQASQPWQGGYSDLQGFQNWYGAQQGGNRPEDMARFLQAPTLERWDQYLIKDGPNAGKYRSMRGMDGVYDKPQECPPGMVPGGPNETDGCVGTPDSAQASSFGTAQPAAPAAAPGLQQMMAQLPAFPAAPASTGQPLAQAMTPYQGTFQSGTQSLLKQAAQPKAQAPSTQGIGIGWSQGQDGLTQMMAKRQKAGQSSHGWWM